MRLVSSRRTTIPNGSASWRSASRREGGAVRAAPRPAGEMRMNGRSKRRAMLASALLGVTVLLGTAGRGAAAPAGNPYNLIDPSTISVGSMGDAKPYTFTDTNGLDLAPGSGSPALCVDRDGAL